MNKLHAAKLAPLLGMVVAIPILYIALGSVGASVPSGPCPSPPGGEQVADEHLGPEQMQVATQIVAAVRAFGPTSDKPHAAVVALATARQESGIRNLRYGDRDSLGAFQQRPSQGWGTPAQILNVPHATTSFLQRLIDIPGWDAMPVTEAAATVQRPAEEYRGLYQQWVPLATELTQRLWGTALNVTTIRNAARVDDAGSGTVTLHQANIYIGETPSQFTTDLGEVLAGLPDFVTLNEVYGRSATDLTPPGYDSWRAASPRDARDAAVLWRTDAWQLIDQGTELMHHRDVKWGTRYVNWVTLRSNLSGELVSVIAGHASPGGPGRAGLFDEFMTRLVSLIGDLSASGPVLFGGDLNYPYPHQQPSETAAFEQRLAAAGAQSTFGALGEPSGGWATGNRHGATIDYIIATGAAPVVHATSQLTNSDHRMLSARLHLGASESCPIVTGSTVVYPVPANLAVTDRHNWGDRGTHWNSRHTGTDFSVPCGTPVLAATGGIIEIERGPDWFGGWLVKVITGPTSVATWYAHLRTVEVTTGQVVMPGQQLGGAGDLGNAIGCHLHFEVHLKNGPIYGSDNVNPTRWLAANVDETPSAPTGPGFDGPPASSAPDYAPRSGRGRPRARGGGAWTGWAASQGALVAVRRTRPLVRGNVRPRRRAETGRGRQRA